MLKVATAEEMRKADRAAIESGIPSFNLMKAAGRAVAQAAARLMGGTYGRRVLVLAGRGNNGGDGLVAARRLAQSGASAKVLLTDDPSVLEGDARQAFDLYTAQRGQSPFGPLTPDSVRREIERSDLVIDALVGTGFRGALRGAAAGAAELANRRDAKILSVDVPSGVDATTGKVEGAAFRATYTVTFAALKQGLLLQPGAGYAGEVEIADIGIDEGLLAARMGLVQAADVAQALPRRDAQAHKRSVGKVLIIAGSPGMSGAAILAASAALRAGAGLVWVAAPRSVAALIEQSVTEAIVRALPETQTGSIAAGALETVLELAGEADAVALGPGLTTERETRQFVRAVVEAIVKPLILDADGINAFAGEPDAIARRGAPTVLTPHAGELARLLDQDVKHIEAEPVNQAGHTAEQTRATVLLKGHPTLIAGVDMSVAVNTGGPFLASAGTGDVLTGVITALAAKTEAPAAAWAGAWLHGVAGRLAAQTHRFPGGGMPDRGIVATDVLQRLPDAILQATHKPSEA